MPPPTPHPSPELVPPDPLDLAKLELFRSQIDLDAVDPRVVELATQLARGLAPDDWMGIAREIFRWVRDGIRYQHDPDRRQLRAPCSDTLDRGWGNCVGKVILVCSLLRALGIAAEMVPVFRGPIMSHVMMRTKFPGSRRVSPDGWIYGEMTIRGAELGQNPWTIARNPETGSLPLSGGPSPGFWSP